MGFLYKYLIICMSVLLQTVTLSHAVLGAEASLAPSDPPYSYASLIGSDGIPTELFLKLKAQTDVLVMQARLSPYYYQSEKVKIEENGSCIMRRSDFATRQALAIASYVDGQKDYAENYSHFTEIYQEMLADVPVLHEGSGIESVFKSRRVRDQYWRRMITKKTKGEGPSFPSQVLEEIFYNYVVRDMCLIDAENRVFLKTFIAENGWPDVEQYGPVINSAAWLITQHADRDLEFQKKVLLLLEPYLGSEFTNKGTYAYLYDRVSVNSSRPQRYGTQIHCKGGVAVPRPLEDKASLNELRAQMDLGSIEDYLALFKHCSTVD